MITIRDGGAYVIPISDIMDSSTGKVRTRLVDVDNMYYKMCRYYMIRLESSDFADFKRLSRLARVANCTPEEFRSQFGYLAEDF